MSGIFTAVGFVYQLVDFLFKAVTTYAATPDGQREWGEVVGAATGIGLVHPDYVSEAFAADNPAPHPEWVNQAADFVARQEQQDKSSAPAAVHKMPLKHEGES